MPTVTVRQPATVKVRVEGQRTKVQTLSYGTKTLRSLTDMSLTGANTGDVIVYNAETNTIEKQIKKDAKIGVLSVEIKGLKTLKYDLYAKENVDKVGYIRKIKRILEYKIKNLLN